MYILPPGTPFDRKVCPLTVMEAAIAVMTIPVSLPEMPTAFLPDWRMKVCLSAFVQVA